MKKVIVVIVILVVGFIVYNQLNKPLSEEEHEVKALRETFVDADKQLRQAESMAARSGVDTTSTYENALNRVKLVQTKLKELMKKLETDSAKKKAEKLDGMIKEFLRRNN